MAKVAPNFDLQEFIDASSPAPHPAGFEAKARAIAGLLQWLRDLAAKVARIPVYAHVTAFWRNPQHNAEVGGVSSSQHLTADAGDSIVYGVSKRALAKAVLDERDAGRLPMFGQLIFYIDEPHTHISAARTNKPNQELLVGWKSSSQYLELTRARLPLLSDVPAGAAIAGTSLAGLAVFFFPALAVLASRPLVS